MYMNDIECCIAPHKCMVRFELLRYGTRPPGAGRPWESCPGTAGPVCACLRACRVGSAGRQRALTCARDPANSRARAWFPFLGLSAGLSFFFTPPHFPMPYRGSPAGRPGAFLVRKRARVAWQLRLKARGHARQDSGWPHIGCCCCCSPPSLPLPLPSSSSPSLSSPTRPSRCSRRLRRSSP